MRRPGCQRRATFARPAGSVPSMTAPMPRLVPLACLLALLLAPAAAQAAGRTGTVKALSAQMRQAGAGSGALRRRPPVGPQALLDPRGDAADAGLGREALHVRDGAAADGAGRAARHRGAGRDGARRRRGPGRPLPPRQRRPELRRRRLEQPRPAGGPGGDPPDHGPRDRGRDGVRHPPRRPVVGLRAELGRRRPALRPDVQPRPHRPQRAVLPEPPGQLRGDVLREAAAPPRRRRRARRAPRRGPPRRPCRSAPGARPRSPTCCAR